MIGEVVLRTLADYQAFTLHGRCLDCDRMEPLDHSALAKKFGADVPIASIREKLVCRVCGRRAEMIVCYNHPSGDGR